MLNCSCVYMMSFTFDLRHGWGVTSSSSLLVDMDRLNMLSSC